MILGRGAFALSVKNFESLLLKKTAVLLHATIDKPARAMQLPVPGRLKNAERSKQRKGSWH